MPKMNSLFLTVFFLLFLVTLYFSPWIGAFIAFLLFLTMRRVWDYGCLIAAEKIAESEHTVWKVDVMGLRPLAKEMAERHGPFIDEGVIFSALRKVSDAQCWQSAIEGSDFLAEMLERRHVRFLIFTRSLYPEHLARLFFEIYIRPRNQNNAMRWWTKTGRKNPLPDTSLCGICTAGSDVLVLSYSEKTIS